MKNAVSPGGSVRPAADNARVRLAALWEKLATFWSGPRCGLHPKQRVGSMFGCETCFKIQWRKEAQEYDAAERERRISEMAEAILRADRMREDRRAQAKDRDGTE